MSLHEYAAESGEAVTSPDDAAPSSPTFEILHTGSITPSLTNPRKTFDQAKLQELANSIKATGLHQPILVRPLPASRLVDTFQDRRPGMPLPSYELIAGERRLRACRLAGVDEIPAMIKHLTDHQVLECQIVENLQRDDLSPLEEAEGYQALIDATGINKDAIGDRIGRSRTYVYGRLKLLDLGVKGREALREGKIDASRALLIARIPDDKLQIKALAEFTATDYHGDARMSYRAALEWIRNNVMLKLADARFNIADANLVVVAGSCKDCEKRTGANPDLFSDVDAPDLCTDPECFSGKGEAHLKAITDQARARGMEVIEGKEALEVKPHRWTREIDGYVPLDKDFVIVDEETKTLRSQLSKGELKGQVKLFVDPHTGDTVEVVPKALADKARAKLRPDDNQEDDDDWEAEQREKTLKRELLKQYETGWRGRVSARLQRHVDEGLVHAFDVPMLRKILALLCLNEAVEVETVERVLQIPEDEVDNDSIMAAVKAIPDDQLGARVVSLLLVNECEDVFRWTGDEYMATETPIIESLATSSGVDLASVKAEVQDEMKAAAVERAKEQLEAAQAAKKSKGGKK